MPYRRDSFVPEEGNLMNLPSRIRNKRSRIEPELSRKTENQTKKRSMTEFYRYRQVTMNRQSHECDNFQHNIINDSNNDKPKPKSSASTSTSSPQFSVLQREHHLVSHHIPLQRRNPVKSPLNLPKFKSYSSSLILSSPSKRFKQPHSTASDFALEFEPTDLAPCAISSPIRTSLKLDPELSPSQFSSKLTFRSDMSAEKNRQRATTGSCLNLGTSSMFSSYIRSDKLSRQSSFQSTTSSEIYKSKTEPHGSSLSLKQSSSKFNSYLLSDKLSRQSSFKSTISSETYQSQFEPCGSSLSNNLFLNVKSELLPSSQLSRRPTFTSTIDSVIKLLSTKSESKEKEELDTQLSLGSSQPSSKAASSSTLDTQASQDRETFTSRGCMLSISKEIPLSQSPERKYTPIISKLGIPSHQLITPTNPTFEPKINFLRPKNKSATDTMDTVRREALAQARRESLRREKLLKEHLKRNKVSSTKAEDLLSQSLRMGRFSIQNAETGEFRGKRSRESSWRKHQTKEHMPARSFREESVWSENSRTRYLSDISSRREIPTSESWWSKYLVASQKQNLTEASSISSQRAKLSLFRSGTPRGELESIPFSAGTKEKEKVKELGGSLQWGPNLEQHKWSPGDIDLNLGLQTPSTSSKRSRKCEDLHSSLIRCLPK